jgi:hypothetical protein
LIDRGNCVLEQSTLGQFRPPARYSIPFETRIIGGSRTKTPQLPFVLTAQLSPDRSWNGRFIDLHHGGQAVFMLL